MRSAETSFDVQFNYCALITSGSDLTAQAVCMGQRICNLPGCWEGLCCGTLNQVGHVGMQDAAKKTSKLLLSRPSFQHQSQTMIVMVAINNSDKWLLEYIHVLSNLLQFIFPKFEQHVE